MTTAPETPERTRRPLMNEVQKPPKFCWLCYLESVQRVAATLPRSQRAALLAAAEAHKMDGGPVLPTVFEHARHPGAKLPAGSRWTKKEEEEAGESA